MSDFEIIARNGGIEYRDGFAIPKFIIKFRDLEYWGFLNRDYDGKKLSFIKDLRTVFRIGLAEAKRVSEWFLEFDKYDELGDLDETWQDYVRNNITERYTVRSRQTSGCEWDTFYNCSGLGEAIDMAVAKAREDDFIDEIEWQVVDNEGMEVVVFYCRSW